MKTIPIAKPFIGKEEIESVIRVLKSGALVQGENVALLEERMCEIGASDYSVATNSGTSALHTALYAVGIGQGDEVITSPFSFVATANAIRMVGAIPVFTDIDERTFNIHPKSIEKVITSRTKAILTVDLYGQLCDYEKIKMTADRYGIPVVSDSAQAIGAKRNEKRIGEMVDVACFSLYATKNITSGEGGMIIMNKKEYYDRARRFRQHGQVKTGEYEYYDLGYNYRMTEIEAAIALCQLERIDEITRKRQQIARKYSDGLYGVDGIVLPFIEEGCEHVFHQYTVRITSRAKKSRADLQESLMHHGIQSRVYYPTPLHELPHLREHSRLGDVSTVETVSKEVLSLPIYPQLEEDDIGKIISNINSVLK